MSDKGYMITLGFSSKKPYSLPLLIQELLLSYLGLGFAFWQMWAGEGLLMHAISGTKLRGFLTWDTSVNHDASPYFIVASRGKKMKII